MRSTALVVCLGFIAVPAAGTHPSGLSDPARLLVVWTDRQTLPAARYQLRWEKFPPYIPPGKPKPGEDGAYTGTGLAILDVAGGRTRLDQDERTSVRNRAERLSRLRESIRYDGREESSYQVIDWDDKAAPAEPGVTTVIVHKCGESRGWPPMFEPLAWGHGLILPTAGTGTGPFPDARRLVADRFHATGTDEIGGRVCVEFRDDAADGRVSFWIDAADGAVLRARYRYRGTGSHEITVRYQDTPHGRLPAGWDVTEAGWETTATGQLQPPTLVTRVTVAEVRFDPPTEDDFRVPLRPGMTVERDGQTWGVGADGSLTLPPVAKRPPPPPESLATRVLHGLYGVAVLAAVAGVVAGLLYVRWRWLRIT